MRSRDFLPTGARVPTTIETNYVNFEGGKFSAPKDVITAEMVDGIAALNSYFLGITAPHVRLLRRVQSDELDFRDAGPAFVQLMQELRAQMRCAQENRHFRGFFPRKTRSADLRRAHDGLDR